MFSCTCHARAAGGLFSRLAKYYHHRYRWFGLERTQRQLVKGLDLIGCQGSSLLEIGCGVGYLHQWLVQRGASQALGVDLSERMLDEARLLAREQRVEDRVSYRQGDFIDLSQDLENADIVILDKVLCCYPDADTLLTHAAKHANQGLGLTYPRVHGLSRIGMGILNRLLAWAGSDFRTFLHDPAHIEQYLAELGWEKAYEARTLLWLTQVYVTHS